MLIRRMQASDVEVSFPVKSEGISGWWKREHVSVVRRVSLELAEGETLGIVGESG